MMDKLVNYLKSKTDQYEVFYCQNNTLDAEMARDKISFVADGLTHGVGVRVCVGGKIGFAYTNNMDHFKNCVDTALKVANVNKSDKNFKGFVKPKKFDNVGFNKKVAEIEAENIHDFSNSYVKNVKSVNDKIMLSLGMFSRVVEDCRIINSEGLDAQMKTALNSFQGILIMKNNGRLETVEFNYGDKKPFIPEKGKDDSERLISLMGKKPMKSSEVQVVMHPEALSALFMQSYAFSVNGENAYLKKSKFHDKIGEKVFDEKLTIKDDALGEGLFCSRPFDNEGTVSQSFNVVEKGVLKNFLFDSYYGGIIGKESTGNASRGVGTLPKIVPNNILMSPGKVRDVAAEMDKGILVRGLLGVHTMNEAVGDFSLGVMEGYYVEKGEIKHPVKDTMIAGNFFDMMNSVECLGKEVKHAFVGNGGCYLPDVMFKKIKVVGV